MLVAQLLEVALWNVANKLCLLFGWKFIEGASFGTLVAPGQRPGEVFCGFASLPQEAVPPEKAEVLRLSGIAESRDDIGQCTLPASLIPDDGNKVGVQRDVAAVEPLPYAGLVTCLGDFNGFDVVGLVGLDFQHLGWFVTNIGAFRRLKNGLSKATERWVGLDPCLLPRGEVTITTLVVTTRYPNEAVSIAP